MKKHSKVGNRAGKPAYRTSAMFKYRKSTASTLNKIKVYPNNVKAMV